MQIEGKGANNHLTEKPSKCKNLESVFTFKVRHVFNTKNSHSIWVCEHIPKFKEIQQHMVNRTQDKKRCVWEIYTPVEKMNSVVKSIKININSKIMKKSKRNIINRCPN